MKTGKLPIYSGKVTVQVGEPISLYFSMEDTSTKEKLYVYIPYIISGETMYGISTGIDFVKQEYSTIYLFSRDDLEDDVARKKIEDKTVGVEPYFLKI